MPINATTDRVNHLHEVVLSACGNARQREYRAYWPIRMGQAGGEEIALRCLAEIEGGVSMPRPDPTCSYQAGAVQAKHTDCGTSESSTIDETGKGGTPSKVVMPVIRTRVEERHNTTGTHVNRRAPEQNAHDLARIAQ